MIKRRILCSLLLVVFCHTIHAQDPVSLFNQRRDSIPSEHIYLQFDQSAYISGETIWFKAYLFSSFTNSNLSTTLYVDMLDDDNKLIATKKFPVFEGTAKGSIDLPIDLAQNVYLVRAYTAWTLNVGERFVFKKGIPVFNPAKKETLSDAGKDHNCIFYPESGQLVNGVPNVVAFKVLNRYFQPEKIKGKLVSSKGVDILELTTDDNGTGRFSFTPHSGEKYIAKINIGDNSTQDYSFPEAIDKGVVLSIGDNSKGKAYAITATGNEFGELLLIAVMQDNIVVQKRIILQDKEASGIINTKELPSGLMQVFLFNKDNRFLCRRNTIINNNMSDLQFELKTDTLNFSAKGENVFTLAFPEKIQGSFSIAVTDATNDNDYRQSNDIMTGLLLQPGNRSLINPLPSNAAKEEWDMLALTNNWPVDLDPRKIKYKDTSYINITGKFIRDFRNTELTGDMNIIVETRDSTQTVFTTPILADNKFKLTNLIYEDSARFYIQRNDKNDRTPVSARVDMVTGITVNESFWHTEGFASYLNTGRTAFIMAAGNRSIAELHKAYNDEEKAINLREVTVKTKKTTPLEKVEKEYATGLFAQQTSKTLDLINNPDRSGAQNVLEYIKGKFPDLRIGYERGEYYIESPRSISMGTYSMSTRARNRSEGLIANSTASPNGLVKGITYLNELPVDTKTIVNLPMSEIAMIKYFTPGTFNMPNVGISCVLAVYTKQAEADRNDVSKLSSFTYPGYSVTKAFSSPDYSTTEKSKKDIRRTLFWNPDILPDGDTQEVKIKFYNSDNAKKFRVIVEGFTWDGRLVHLEKIINK